MDDATSSHEASKDRKPVDWFRDAWAQALLAVGAAEEEAGKVLHKAGELAGWKPEDARKIAKDFGERLATQRRELDEGVSRAVARVKFPKREEIDALSKRVGRIAGRIEALEKRRK